MKKYQHLIDGKSNEELLNILKEYQKYEPKYVEEIEEELGNRGVKYFKSIEAKEQKEIKVEKPIFKTSEEYQEHLKEYTSIGGWLWFFLVSMVCGAILSVCFTIPSVIDFIENEKNLPILLLDITIRVEGLIMIGYFCYAFVKREANAVFWARVYLYFRIAITIIITMLTVQDNEIGSMIRTLIWSVIWFIFLEKSENVKEVIPQDYREVTKLDWIVVIIIILVTILSFILSVNQLS